MMNSLRMTKDDFYQFAEEYFNKAIIRVKKDMKAEKMSALPSYKEKVKAMNELNKLSLYATTHEVSREKMLQAKANVAVLSNDLWKDSLNAHSNEWVIRVCLLNSVFNQQFACIDYVCSKNVRNFDLQILKEMIYIGSDIFTFEYWTDKMVDAACKIFIYQNEHENRIGIKRIRNFLPQEAESTCIKKLSNTCRDVTNARVSAYKYGIERSYWTISNYRHLKFMMYAVLDNLTKYLDNNVIKKDEDFPILETRKSYFIETFLKMKEACIIIPNEIKILDPDFKFSENKLPKEIHTIFNRELTKMQSAKGQKISFRDRIFAIKNVFVKEINKVNSKISNAEARISVNREKIAELTKDHDELVEIYELPCWNSINKEAVIDALRKNLSY